MMANSSACASVASTTATGTSCRPARCAARQRRSPAMISNVSPLPAHRPHHDRLDDAALADRIGELVKLGVGEMCGADCADWRRDFDRRSARFARRLSADEHFLADVADQRGQAASQSRMIRHRRRS